MDTDTHFVRGSTLRIDTTFNNWIMFSVYEILNLKKSPEVGIFLYFLRIFMLYSNPRSKECILHASKVIVFLMKLIFDVLYK